jgi:glycosyltransferase involved in cell wall biosynthesis
LKKVLYLSYDGLTDPLGQSQILPYITGLSKEGYSFAIISFEKKDRFQKQKEQISKICRENGIQWLPLNYTKKPPVLSTLKDIRQLRKQAYKLVKENKIDIVHCRSYITALVGLWLKKKWGVKMVFDMRGFWADERIDGGIWSLSNPFYRIIYRFFKKKELQFFKEADHTISLTYDAKKEIESWPALKDSHAPIEVIPCCVDLQLFDPSKTEQKKKEEIKNALGILPGQKIVGYIGSIGTWYMLNEMLDFIKIYLQRNPSAIFLLVTKDEKEPILNAAATKGISTSIKIVEGNREEVPAYIACSDFSLFFIKPAYSKRASSPTKQGEIMAMGIPLICNDKVGDSSEVVRKYESGFVVNGFSESFYNETIERLEVARFDPVKIRQGAEDFYSLETGVQRYVNVYKRLFS